MPRRKRACPTLLSVGSKQIEFFGESDMIYETVANRRDDGGSRSYLAAPQRLGNILHTTHGNTCEAHLDESFFHAALPAAIPFNNSSFKRDTP